MSAPKYSIIPKPQKYETLPGTYTVTSKTKILCVPEFLKAGNYLSSFLKTAKDANDGAIKINKDSKIRKEGYTLNVSPDGVVISASDERGAFYGAVTLKILLMQAKQGNGVAVVNGTYIYDYPRYLYRGGQIEESRHFFGKDAVIRALDSFALLKLNKMHWHLSDDQGYRIESDEFPLLNEIASKRKYEYLSAEGNRSKHPAMQKRGDEYFHYYKKSEIREIVEYANKLCIDIIPEIDIPGHTVAFLAAYNELSCLKGNYEVHCESGITKDVLCVSSEFTINFVEKLLKEVSELFPYEYFHIGGDEASKGHKIWEKECPSCQQAIKDLGLKNGAELQTHFMNRINNMFKEMGKKCIVWNDGITESTDDDITCHYWVYRGNAWKRRENNKRNFIVSPCPRLYFDYNHATSSLKKVYNYKVEKSGFLNNQNVWGIEFETWAEWIVTESGWQNTVYPRIFAVSESAWTEDNKKNYKDFYKRLNFFKMYMRSKGINYSRIEKKTRKIKYTSPLHMGHMGDEYKYNEELKKLEK